MDRVRLRLDPAAPPLVAAVAAPTAAEAPSSASTIIACRRLAPADTVNGSGSGIASASVGAAEDGKGGNAVNVKGGGDPGDVGNGWRIGAIMLIVLVVGVRCGFSLACMADANARGLRVREAGAVGVGVGVGSGRVVTAGGEGSVDGDGVVGPVVVIACDNFDGARGPCNRRNQQKNFQSVPRVNLPRKGERALTCSRGCCGTAGALFARGVLELALSLPGPV